MLDPAIQLERDIVAIRTAGVKALLDFSARLEAQGVQPEVLARELFNLCQNDDEHLARVARCALKAHSRR